MGNNTLLTTTDHDMGTNTLVTTIEAGIENSTTLPPMAEANGTLSTPRDPVSESFTSGTVSVGTELSSTFVTFTGNRTSTTASTTEELTYYAPFSNSSLFSLQNLTF